MVDGRFPRGDPIPLPPMPMIEYEHYEVYGASVSANGETVDESNEGEYPFLKPWVIEGLADLRLCPYCKSRIIRAGWHLQGRHQDSFATFRLRSCEYCGYWQFHEQSQNPLWTHMQWNSYVSRARSFESSLEQEISTDLAQALRRNRSNWVHFDARRFERFVGSVIKANAPDTEVIHIGQSHDGGVDLLLIRGQTDTLIQVKRRLNERAESVDTVRNLLGVMYHDRSLRGVVITTAHRFSPAAKDLAGLVDGVIELIDRGKLNLMLSPLIPETPWECLIDDDAVCTEFERALPALTRKVLRTRVGATGDGGALTERSKRRSKLIGMRRPISGSEIDQLRSLNRRNFKPGSRFA